MGIVFTADADVLPAFAAHQTITLQRPLSILDQKSPLIIRLNPQTGNALHDNDAD